MPNSALAIKALNRWGHRVCPRRVFPKTTFMKIDSHQHFWYYDPVKDGWIPDEMSVIRRDLLPEDVWPAMQRQGFDGSVLVQADQSERETHFLLDLAAENPFILGVVGWVDLRDPGIAGRLDYFSRFPLLKGFRHIVQAEPRVDFLLDPAFGRGIALLGEYGYTYDILIYPRHLAVALEFVRRFPEQRFVIDHLAKPEIRFGRIDPWREQIRAFAAYPQVYCKIAGLVTEADQRNWTLDPFRAYVDVVIETFGFDRVLFGSDWPVCLPAASYDQVCEIVETCTAGITDEEKAKLWGGSCAGFYNLRHGF